MLNFGKKFGIFCFLDNHGYEFNKSYECIAGAGVIESVISMDVPGLNKLDQFQKKNKEWIFGHIAYDVKNEIENFESSNPDGIQFPDIHFFVPEIVFILKKNECMETGSHRDLMIQNLQFRFLHRKKCCQKSSPGFFPETC